MLYLQGLSFILPLVIILHADSKESCGKTSEGHLKKSSKKYFGSDPLMKMIMLSSNLVNVIDVEPDGVLIYSCVLVVMLV